MRLFTILVFKGVSRIDITTDFSDEHRQLW